MHRPRHTFFLTFFRAVLAAGMGPRAFTSERGYPEPHFNLWRVIARRGGSNIYYEKYGARCEDTSLRVFATFGLPRTNTTFASDADCQIKQLVESIYADLGVIIDRRVGQCVVQGATGRLVRSVPPTPQDPAVWWYRPVQSVHEQTWQVVVNLFGERSCCKPPVKMKLRHHLCHGGHVEGCDCQQLLGRCLRRHRQQRHLDQRISGRC